MLRLQRRRWHRGLAEILVRHRRMLFRPRYGVVGMMTMPWFLLFELLSPVVEVLGLAYFFMLLVFLGVEQWVDAGLDLVDPAVLLIMLTASVLFSVFVTLVALLAEEVSFRRYRGLPDLFRAIYAAIEENVGYRQLNAWWRLGGIIEALRGTQPPLGRHAARRLRPDVNGGRPVARVLSPVIARILVLTLAMAVVACWVSSSPPGRSSTSARSSNRPRRPTRTSSPTSATCGPRPGSGSSEGASRRAPTTRRPRSCSPPTCRPWRT